MICGRAAFRFKRVKVVKSYLGFLKWEMPNSLRVVQIFSYLVEIDFS